MAPSLACLTPEELELVEALRRNVAPMVQSDAGLMCFCNDWTYVRYLRARSWDLPKALKMLRATLEWRLEYRPERIRWDDIKLEAETGKQLVMCAADREGRPVMMLRPRHENTRTSATQLQYVVYSLEKASRLADEFGVGKLTILVDFEGYSIMNAPSVKTSMATLQTLQNHYPERLGAAVCYHAPRIFSATWAAISPFIDKVTYKKIQFVNKGDKAEAALMAERFDMAHMDASLGGALGSPMFVLEEYAARMCEEDAQAQAQLDEAAASLAKGCLATAGAVVSLERLQLKEGRPAEQQLQKQQRRLSTEVAVAAS